MNRRRFTTAMISLAGGAIGGGAAEAGPLKPVQQWRVLFNDDGSNNLVGASYPLTRTELERQVDFLVRHGVDAYAWCTSLPDLCWYGTKVGESVISPERRQRLNSASSWFMAENLRCLLEAGDDPIQVLAGRCHYHGIPFLASVRMNDSHHRNYESAWLASKFFLEHPNWCLRDESGQLLGGMDYAIPEVRDHRMKILQEQAENYDVDGLELDWMRWPPFFHPARARQDSEILTRYVQEIREMLDRAAKKRGRARLLLGVRVPATREECRDLGIDVAAMIRGGSIDYLCPTDFIRPDFNVPVETFKELTRGTDCGLFPTVLPGGVSKGFYRVLNIRQYRAIANNFYEGGADGISTFNIMPGDIENPGYRALLGDAFSMLGEVKDARRLKTLERHYVFYPLYEGRSPTGKVIDRRILLDRATEVGIRKVLPFRVMEDFGDGRWRYVFRFLASNITPKDEIGFDLNGKPIGRRLKRVIRPGGRAETHWILGIPSLGSLQEYEMELDTTLAKKGDNELGAKLVRANSDLKEWSVDYLGPSHAMKVDPIVIQELEVRLLSRAQAASGPRHSQAR